MLGRVAVAKKLGEAELGVTSKMNSWRGEMKLRSLLLCVLFIMGTAGQVYGQGGGSGTILGTVTDTTGGVIANAKVDVTNIATGVVIHTQTSSTGDYTFPYLNPATYRVTVTVTGFQKSVSNDFTLAVDQQARVNIVLKPGAVTEIGRASCRERV